MSKANSHTAVLTQAEIELAKARKVRKALSDQYKPLYQQCRTLKSQLDAAENQVYRIRLLIPKERAKMIKVEITHLRKSIDHYHAGIKSGWRSLDPQHVPDCEAQIAALEDEARRLTYTPEYLANLMLSEPEG